jgi:N-acetylglutamate synthase-like GNAT family acetyltransferase
MFSLRPAAEDDALTIRRIIYLARINPTDLNWMRFTLAVDEQGQIIGCGQVKPHADGSLELASIAVIPAWQKRGVARGIIEHLVAQHTGTLYLTCRSSLEPFYERFGFHAIELGEMPPSFQRNARLYKRFQRLFKVKEGLSVMQRN